MRLMLLAVIFAAFLVNLRPAIAQVPSKGGLQPLDRRDPGKPGRYVPFPFSNDIEGRVADQLRSVEATEPFKKMLEKALRDPGKLGIDEKTIKKLLDNPDLQKKLQDLAAKHQPDKALSPEELKKLKSLIDLPPPQGTSPDTPTPPTGTNRDMPAPVDLGKDRTMPAAGNPELPNPPPHGDEEPMRDWLKGALEKAQESRVGDMLRESPAWQKAIDNLELSLEQPAANAAAKDAWGLDKLAGRFLSPDKLKFPDLKLTDRLGKLKAPNLPHWDWTMPGMSRPNLPSVPVPSVPTAAGLGTVAAWLLCCGLFAVLAWQASRWFKGRAPEQSAATGLGPWPVDPRNIATRAELVLAFDYLALLVIGTQARALNHNAVARSLGTEAADQLAALYEQARYTEGAATLPLEEPDRARRALAEITGATPA